MPAEPDVRTDLVVRQLFGTWLDAALRAGGLARIRVRGGQSRSRAAGEAQKKSAIDVRGHGPGFLIDPLILAMVH